MLSFASKRAIPITRHHQRLQASASISATSSVRQQRARLATVAASSTRKPQPPIVISRRAWLDFKESRGITKRRPNASKRPKSDDEKPWPRNMQIAGYLAGTLAVPYIILWTITSNPTLREWFGPYIPLDKLRTHYGKLEWDAQSYSEEMDHAKSKEKNGNDESQLSIGYYQFPEEAPFHKRRQQEIVEAMNGSDIKVTLSLPTSSSSPSLSEEIVTKKIAGKTVANAKNILECFPSALTLMDENMTVAVDFLDQKDEGNDADLFNVTSNTNDSATTIETSYDGTLMTDTDSMENVEIRGGHGRSHDLSSGSRQMTKDTQTNSKWTYVPQAASESSKNTANNASSIPQLTEMQIEMGRLEYEISELEKNLRDPMCTRSIDDMTTELRQANRELSRLTWKKRLGFSR